MEANTPLPYRIPQLTKSDSTVSAGGGSVKSVSFLGVHPLGTLRVHDATESSPMEADDEDEGPPALDPPAAQEPQPYGGLKKVPQTSVSPFQEPFVHGMGGGDVVLILDLPEVFTVGYDSVSFTAKHFGGVRDIPPGPHFFWVAHPGGLSARCGFWIVATGVNTVHVVQWDKFNEVLTESAHAEALIQADNIDTFHSKLVPYSDPSAVNSAHGDLAQSVAEKNLKIWEQLTRHISVDLLNRVAGQHSDNWMVHTGDRVNGSFLNAAEMDLDRSISNPLLQTRELNFAFDQRSKTYSTATSGAERTLEATDSTRYITSTVENPETTLTNDEVIGEFQFAYLVGVLLGNDSCIQQWWYLLLKVFLRGYFLLSNRPAIASAFLHTLTAQIHYSTSWLDGSLFDHADSHTRDLRLALTVYKRRLDELLLTLNTQVSPDQLAVGNAFSGLEAIVASELDWDLRGDYLRRGNVMMEDGEQVELEVADFEDEDERGEWAPAVVDLDESGRQRDLISWRD